MVVVVWMLLFLIQLCILFIDSEFLPQSQLFAKDLFLVGKNVCLFRDTFSVLRSHSSFYTQKLFLAGLGDHMGS